jgi:hypothetical protein
MSGLPVWFWAVWRLGSGRGPSGLADLVRFAQALLVFASGGAFGLALMLRQSLAALGLFDGGLQREVERCSFSAYLVEVAAACLLVAVAGVLECLLPGAVQFGGPVA